MVAISFSLNSWFPVSDNQFPQLPAGDVRHFDDNIPHLALIVHFSHVMPLQLLLQLLNKVFADMFRIPAMVRLMLILSSGAPSAIDDLTL
jgi:hypothetical protein